MKKTIYESDFIQEFADYNRADQFSKQALSLLFDYFEDSYDDYELDVNEICGDYSEMSLLRFVEDYDLEIEDWIDDYDIDDDKENEFNEDSYLKSISEVINECPDHYKDYKILNDKLVTRYDNEASYRILLCGIYEDENWKQETTIYFITNLDYKYKDTAKTNSEAVEIGNSLDSSEFNTEVEEEKEKDERSETKKKLSWENIDEDKLEEIISEYITDRSGLVGFTNQGTVVFQDF